MSDWRESYGNSQQPGTITHPDAPAGGPGPGSSRAPGADVHWPASPGVAHPDSPAAHGWLWQHTAGPAIDFEERTAAVWKAIVLAKNYVGQAILNAINVDLGGILAGIVSGLLLFLGIVALSTIAGAAAGAALGALAGALAGGIGAVPGAVAGGAAGAEFGLAAGVEILNYLGLAFLIVYIGKGALQGLSIARDAVSMAWHSYDTPPTQPMVEDQAARDLAKAVALIVKAILQGVVAYLLAKGTAAAASRVPELVSLLRNSKLGAGFADWVEANWQSLIKNPLLQDESSGAGAGSVTESEVGSAADPTPAPVVKAPPAAADPALVAPEDPVTPAEDPATPAVPQNFATAPNEAVFWSGKTAGVGGADVAGDIATSQGGTTLKQLVDSRGIDLPAWDANDPAVVQAWQNASQSYAQGASGSVTAVIGDNLRPGNVWESVELPALEANPNVTEIIQVDPATGARTTIFSR